MNFKKSYNIAVIAIAFALIFVAMMLDKLFSLLLPVSMACIVLLVTFSICFTYNDWLMGFLVGLLFGLASFCKAFLFGEATFVTFGVYSILIYVLPRCFVGISAFAVYRLLLTFFKNQKSKTAQHVSMVVGTFIGLAINTLLFLTALNIAKGTLGEEYTPLLLTIKAVIFTNIIPEYLISMIFAPMVVLGVRKGLKLGIDGNNLKRAQEQELLQDQFDEDIEIMQDQFDEDSEFLQDQLDEE